MYIAELRLSGFKSFVDHVRAPIEPGLTGVVGPNGCGKSNLLEAVRWVMGSTSAKSMRADEMDSVIFAGSAVRPAREHAEVTLLLKEAEGRGPGALANDDTLEVSRRIRRGLGSTYRINGKEVRAKDVQLLFADASTGANSPALVRQGQISELIAAKPENRRRILEEAAGIAGLHARRHEADLKLNAAEANLTRLQEVLAEIEAQAANLKKQARQAERYRGLAAAIRQTEALLFHRRWMDARAAVAHVEEELRAAERDVAQAATIASSAATHAEQAREALAPLREEEAVASAILRRLEGARVGHERDLSAAEERLGRANADLERLAAEAARQTESHDDAHSAIARLEVEADALPENGEARAQAITEAERLAQADENARAEAEQKLEALAAEAAAHRARVRTLAETAQAARARFDRLSERLASLEAALSTAQPPADLQARIRNAEQDAALAGRETAVAHEALEDAEAALQEAEAADEAAHAPAHAAEQAVRELQAEIRALEQLAQAGDSKEFPPVLGEIIVTAGYERALGAALGDDLEASLHPDAPLRWTGARASDHAWPADIRPLLEFAQAPPQLAARLALTGVVDAEGGAVAQDSLPPGVRLVSLDGDLWRWDGFVRAASAPSPAAARLEQHNRLRAARAELTEAQARLAQAQAQADKARAARRAAEDASRSARRAAPTLAQKANDAVRTHDALAGEAARATERVSALSSQIEQTKVERADAEAAAGEAGSASEETPSLSEDTLAAARTDVEERRRAAAESHAAVASLVRERAARAARLDAVSQELAQWRARAKAAAAHLDEIEMARARVHAAREAALAAPDSAREALAKLLDEQRAAEARRADAADNVASAERDARERDQNARERETEHSLARERRAACEARLAGGRERLGDVETQAREVAQQPPEDLAGAAGSLLTSPLGTGPITDIERRLERQRSERDQAGPVNLRAEEEMSEAVKRIEELARERDDVAAAVAKLRRAISQLNSEGRERLLTAFTTVNAHFATLFTTLFEGGAAELHLTESEDPLAAGLEIMAQPPGKKLTTLSLMSGGEQALTATALIFAVFLANPAPICVLDEVDAPLDDANVDRFCRMLDEMKKLTSTRFLVITHNPVTMARVDRLFGVTMPELGLSQLVSVDLGRAQQLAAA